jgi:hypothetical protein
VTARRAYVYEAELELAPGADARAPGGAVTVALCGHWDHEGPCRWPHYSEIDTDHAPARLCTVFACPEDEVAEVHAAIDTAVRTAADWTVASSQRREPHGEEVDLGERLAHDNR